MAKRFTDTEIWDKEWFMLLSLKHKCLIRFIFDKCDVAGIWSPNWTLATACIGDTVTEEDLQQLSGQVQKIAPGKFFVSGFISFQYGELSENCKPHQKVIATLRKYNLPINEKERVTPPFEYPLQRVQEKEEDKEKEKEEDKEKPREEKNEILVLPIEKKIWAYFELNEITHFNQIKETGPFVTILKNSGRLEEFETEFEAYRDYKERSNEKEGTLRSFLGTAEKNYADGRWCSTSWQKQLKDFKAKHNEKNSRINTGTGTAPSYIPTNDNDLPRVHR